jgi:hypothetical protein
MMDLIRVAHIYARVDYCIFIIYVVLYFHGSMFSYSCASYVKLSKE